MKLNEQKIENLTPSEALVLQQIYEDGSDDVKSLSKMLGLSSKKILAIVSHLKNRGLVAIENNFGELWIELSNSGKRLIKKLWPEFSYAGF